MCVKSQRIFGSNKLDNISIAGQEQYSGLIIARVIVHALSMLLHRLSVTVWSVSDLPAEYTL
jgi:hypothetical protein